MIDEPARRIASPTEGTDQLDAEWLEGATSGRDGEQLDDCGTLLCMTDPSGGVRWLNPLTGVAVRIERHGTYRISRHHWGPDQPVVLGQLPAREASQVLDEPQSVASRQYARELMRVLETARSTMDA